MSSIYSVDQHFRHGVRRENRSHHWGHPWNGSVHRTISAERGSFSKFTIHDSTCFDSIDSVDYFIRKQNVALLDICENRENVQQLQDEFPQANIVYLSLDASIRAAVEETFKQILDRFHQIDIAINCAGILNELDLQRTINVNLVNEIDVLFGYRVPAEISLFAVDWTDQYVIECNECDE